MVRRIVGAALAYPLLVLGMAVALVGLGLWAYAHLDIEAYPDPAPAIVEVIAQFPGGSAEEVERYKHPAAFESKGGKVAQPKPDPSKPLMQFPPDARIWTMPDEEVTRTMSETTPPVDVKKSKAA